VPDLEHYQRFLVGKLLNLPIVREVKSNIAIQTLKAGAPLPLEHLDTRAEPMRSRRGGRLRHHGEVLDRPEAGPWPPANGVGRHGQLEMWPALEEGLQHVRYRMLGHLRQSIIVVRGALVPPIPLHVLEAAVR
jgi:hypothetical protein